MPDLHDIEGHPLRNPFWRNLDEGLINYRDLLQFELKSEFFIHPELKKNKYTQEFYLFIPETLQINKHTYSSDRFYLDQTSLIRYRTPRLSLEELLDSKNKNSPFLRIQQLEDPEDILYEYKILGNIFRSTIRITVRRLLKQLKKGRKKEIKVQVEQFCAEIWEVRETFVRSKETLSHRYSHVSFDDQANYVDEFMSVMVDDYLAVFLEILREEYPEEAEECQDAVCGLLIEEQQHRSKHHLKAKKSKNKESVLLRKGLLEKFMLQSLRLNNNRVELKEKLSNYFGAFAAGIAMLVYMVLFVWHASGLVVTSAPFVMSAVLLYILKDRIKEGLRNLYQRRMHKVFSDFKTSIFNPMGEKIGQLAESFSFISLKKLPEEIYKIRYEDLADQIEAFRPSETVMQYKREVLIYQQKNHLDKRKMEMNTIFRYNIQHFLEKANDALQPLLRLDPESKELTEKLLPKVYHITILLKNTYLDEESKEKSEIKTFRVVIDKVGIRRVEHLSTHYQN